MDHVRLTSSKNVQVPQTQVKTIQPKVNTVTPKTKTATQVQDINDIVSLVDKEFKKREDEILKLVELLQEKEQELKYCEKETKKQAEALSLFNSSVTFRRHTYEQLKIKFDKYKTSQYKQIQEFYIFDQENIIESKLFYFKIFITKKFNHIMYLYIHLHI